MVSTRSKSKYISEVREVRNFASTRETTLRISRNSSTKQIDVNEIHKILTGIQNNSPPDTKFLVRGLNGQRFFTLKSFDADELIELEDFEDYYKNSVKEVDKFEKFAFLEITSLTKIEKPKVEKKPKTKKLKNKIIN